MKFKTTQLRDAITVALVVGVSATAGTGAAFAQTTSTASATTLDRIEVTGTRIRQVDTETAQPVLIISREDIDKQGFTSVADILQNISAIGTPPLSRAAPLSSGENAGGTFISLRNLGGQRTLVLVNGKRLGISTSGFADISLIPTAAVERIEVLKDGASSIYGSDAVGGVINVITRTNFEGASASAYYGHYGEGVGEITKGDFVMGFTGDRGSVTVAAEWGKEDGVMAKDRPFSAFPRGANHPFDNWTAVGQFGGFAPSFSQRALFPGVTFNSPSAALGPNPVTRAVLRSGGDPRNPLDYINQNLNTGGCNLATPASPGPQTCIDGNPLHKSNTNQQTSLRTALDRKSVYV
ncbi:MAG: TonB-dependent receptor plug domain-containing protein, partial [Pseudoxanthomonas sp.]|nr:TonB-dependent receptor plug domain-containing protein [Pseudoxanthomonas sp.]